MCRMLGIKNFIYPKHKHIVEKFFPFAENGKVPPNSSKGHLDGWGIGWYKNGQAENYRSGKSVVEEKEKFWNVIKTISETKILIIHFRKSAWENTNSEIHSHPFKDTKSQIIFAHNGTIFDYKNLLKYITKDLKFCLDSEVYFNLILEYYNRKNNLKEAFLDAVKIIERNSNYTSLTCIFSEGKNLYCFRKFTKLPRYYTLYTAKIKNTQVVASEPLNKQLSWKLLPQSKLEVF
ncbi:MAG: class II glutamine amidotransferase [Endomicrobia bacterium]|nr:class II glutamine amidotransferase [Endomicrobiia bacterium]MDW8055179.1 class II glutamine amidotransferase [Elusimicrobiota bacterium]